MITRVYRRFDPGARDEDEVILVSGECRRLLCAKKDFMIHKL